jgi:hypothetical protein
MYFFNKTIFVNNLSNIHSVFTKNYIIQKTWIPTSICSEKIAIKHYKDESDPEYMIRIWRTNTIFDYWYNGFTCGNFIASLYYTKNEDSIKITYLALNDSSYRSFDKNSDRINNKDSDAIASILIDYIKEIGKEENKRKIIIDVHSNLSIYKKDYEKRGFVLTNRRCLDNSYWIETEYILFREP